MVIYRQVTVVGVVAGEREAKVRLNPLTRQPSNQEHHKLENYVFRPKNILLTCCFSSSPLHPLKVVGG